jgi:hypothetical protein
VALVAAFLSVARPAFADVQYDTSGEDVYRIVSSGTSSKVSYAGTERLSARREGRDWRFEVRAWYTRAGPDGNSRTEARFVQILLPNGTFEDRLDNDPDFLTILNQPFAVRLDLATLGDLRNLRGRVPFSATSPLGAETVLHGFLRPVAGGPIDGRQTVGVRFEAEGAMTGPLPGYAETLISGSMRMDGTAYYALDGAMLLALSIRLTIDARLAQSQLQSLPVRILYRRSIRATPKMPPPALPAKDGETDAHATP